MFRLENRITKNLNRNCVVKLVEKNIRKLILTKEEKAESANIRISVLLLDWDLEREVLDPSNGYGFSCALSNSRTLGTSG